MVLLIVLKTANSPCPSLEEWISKLVNSYNEILPAIKNTYMPATRWMKLRNIILIENNLPQKSTYTA